MKGVHERRPLNIPGWSVGYDDSINAFAATRSPKKDWLFIMTSSEFDREPQALDEEVVVGLYFFDDDIGDWEQVGYQDFDTVSEVLKLNDVELWLRIEHGLSVEQSRQLLIDELTDWGDIYGGEPVDDSRSARPFARPPKRVETPNWAEPIFKDSGFAPEEYDVDMVVAEAIEQVLNASHGQILEYMNARTEAINE